MSERKPQISKAINTMISGPTLFSCPPSSVDGTFPQLKQFEGIPLS